MIYLIRVITVTACFFLADFSLDLDKVEKNRFLRRRSPTEQTEQIVEKRIGKRRRLFFSLVIAIAAAVTMWRLTAAARDTLIICKLAFLLVCLTGSGCVDYIEHRIPNIFPGILAVGAVSVLTMEYITGRDGASAYIFSGVFAAAVSSGCLIIGSILSRGGIGIGDIKLIAALALMGGVYVTGGTIFWGMTACAAVSIGLFAAKKKTMKDFIPFGPFILFGYMITVCMAIY